MTRLTVGLRDGGTLTLRPATVRACGRRLPLAGFNYPGSGVATITAYAGTTPRVHASGDRTRYGRTRPDVNRYLKWAFAEAANSVAVNHRRCAERHVSRLYQHLRERKGHSRAIGAVARHLAEAAFQVLSRQETYRDPTLGRTREV